MLKTAAYILSIAGLGLFAVAAWVQANPDSAVRPLLAGGAILSIAGLILRLVWHCFEQRVSRTRMSGNGCLTSPRLDNE